MAGSGIASFGGGVKKINRPMWRIIENWRASGGS